MFAAADANSRQNAQLAPGFDIFFNNLETGALALGGGLEWLLSPVLAPLDAYVGRPSETLTGGAIRREAVGNAVLDTASMIAGPEIAGSRRAGATSALSLADDVLDGLPLSQAEMRGVRRYNPDIPGHVLAADAEAQLARAVQSMDDMQVIRWGDPIGANGSDVISVNTRTAEVYLWDAKYRSAGRRLTESDTFRDEIRLAGALGEARTTIRDGTLLAPDIQARALANLQAGIFNTRTVAYGAARNSVIRRAGPDQ